MTINTDKNWWDNLPKVWQVELIENLVNSPGYKIKKLTVTEIFDIIDKNDEKSDQIISHIVNLTNLVISQKVLFDLSPLFYLKKLKDFRLPYKAHWEDRYSGDYLRIYPKALRSRVRGVLNLHGLDIDDFKVLGDFVNVEGLQCQSCGIKSLEGIQRMKKLRSLEADQGNSYSDLNPLRGLNLKNLNMQFTKVTDISPLIDVPSLEWVDLSYLRIKDLSPLLQLPNLKGVTLPDGQELSLSELKLYLKQKFGLYSLKSKIGDNPSFEKDRTWYLRPFDADDIFFGVLEEGKILKDNTAFQKPNPAAPESKIIITDFTGLCSNLSAAEYYPVELDPATLIDKIDEHSWYASEVKVLKSVNVWDLLRTSFNNILVGTINLRGQIAYPDKIQLPTVVYGSLILNISQIPLNLSLPAKVKGELRFESCAVPDNLRLPHEVDQITYSNCTFNQRILTNFKFAPKLTFEECNLPGIFTLPDTPIKHLAFRNMTIPAGIIFPESFTGTIHIMECEFTKGIQLPATLNGRLEIKRPRIKHKLKLPSEGDYEFEISGVQDLPYYDIPEYIRDKVIIDVDDLPFKITFIMIIINACIYNSTELGKAENEKLNIGLKQLGIEHFINVFTGSNLLKELDENREKEILLFANFPPKEFYLKHGVARSVLEDYENNVPDWKIPEYKASAGLFTKVCKEYKIKAIHFITGARGHYLSDSLILSLTGNIPTTIKRKEDWTSDGANFDVMRRLYMMQKIKEAVL